MLTIAHKKLFFTKSPKSKHKIGEKETFYKGLSCKRGGGAIYTGGIFPIRVKQPLSCYATSIESEPPTGSYVRSARTFPKKDIGLNNAITGFNIAGQNA